MIRARQFQLADGVWAAAAMLHRTYPSRESFGRDEIIAQLRLFVPNPGRSAKWHVTFHTVANLPPSPGKLRMLYCLPDGTYRLYRSGDDFHADRTGRTHPRIWDFPRSCTGLLTWYSEEYCVGSSGSSSRR